MRRFLTALALCAAALAAETHTVYPVKHSRVFTAQQEPIARVRSGDTIVTRTWDSGGKDEKGVWHIQHPYVYPEHGNPLTGPFYIEGAEHGDALEVSIDRIRLNRSDGYSSFRVNPAVFRPGADLHDPKYGMDAVRKGTATLLPWEIDTGRGVLRPKLRPQDSSGWQIEIPARPMLGCIGVAPAYDEVRTSGPSGSYGGNIDYNDIVEGATVFLPVYANGAHLFIGDAHARQGDGEGWGNGVETSTDVQLTVRLHKGKRLRIPRLINDTHLVSIGSQPEFGSSMDFALRASTTDMLEWLTEDCGLTGPEAHVLLGGVVEHKIVTYYGSVATMIPKRYVPPRCHVFSATRIDP